MGKGDNGGFSEEQVAMYKDCFKLMDMDKDGTISKNDLRAAFDNVGKLMDESELEEMLGEVGGACTFDNMIKMFQDKMAGGTNDPDDLIVAAFKAFDTDGKINAEMFRHALLKFGDKFSSAEVDDIFGEFELDDDGFYETKQVIGLFVAGGGEEEKKEEAKPAPVEEAPAEEAPADDGGKKKKKKKKAAK
jgi:Ca2+-binding EF-hand superfamily protein